MREEDVYIQFDDYVLFLFRHFGLFVLKKFQNLHTRVYNVVIYLLIFIILNIGKIKDIIRYRFGNFIEVNLVKFFGIIFKVIIECSEIMKGSTRTDYLKINNIE